VQKPRLPRVRAKAESILGERRRVEPMRKVER
jgi:hypothetical protein